MAGAPVAIRALKNIQAICEALAEPITYTLDVVDPTQEPELAESAQIIAIPTLVREEPKPVRKSVGDLTHTGRVLAGLGLHPTT